MGAPVGEVACSDMEREDSAENLLTGLSILKNLGAYHEVLLRDSIGRV